MVKIWKQCGYPTIDKCIKSYGACTHGILVVRNNSLAFCKHNNEIEGDQIKQSSHQEKDRCWTISLTCRKERNKGKRQCTIQTPLKSNHRSEVRVYGWDYDVE